jgi:hypothetical protein
MAATPCEAERTKGGEPRGARGPMSGAIFRPGTPFVVSQAVGVAHAKSGDEYLCIQSCAI